MIDAPPTTPHHAENAGRHYTYQKQYRKCGKPTCSTCARGPGHGPYWYAYYREGAKVRTMYLGRHDPTGGVGGERARALLKVEQEQKRSRKKT